MNKGKSDDKASTRHQEENNTKPADVQKAHREADKDIANDPELSAHSPNDDLDEEESARLGKDKTDLA